MFTQPESSGRHVQLLEKALLRRGLHPGATEWLMVSSNAQGEVPQSAVFRAFCHFSFQPDFKLSLRSGSFGLASVHFGASEMTACGVVMREVFRVLRPGGVACFFGRNPWHPENWFGSGGRSGSHVTLRSAARRAGFQKPRTEFFRGAAEYVMVCVRPEVRAREAAGWRVPDLIFA